jgi:hypothetical protein
MRGDENDAKEERHEEIGGVETPDAIDPRAQSKEDP